MKRTTQSGLITVIGLIAGTAAVNGLFLNFVKPSLKIPLIVASAVLVAMGIYGVLFERADAHPHRAVDLPDPDPDDSEHRLQRRGPSEVDPATGEHSHDRGPRIGWLLAVPFLLLSMVVPPPLGAYSAQRDSGLVPAVKSADGLGALPPSEGPIELSLSEFSARALYDPSQSLTGRTVRLTGFVSSREGGEGWVLTRMALSCCAADGYGVKVDVRGGERLPDNTWLTVEGTWVPTPAAAAPQGLPILRIESVRVVPKPANPYE